MTMTAQEYRANARQCLSWAESASDPENRDAFFDLAATWVAAAARIEHAARVEKSTAATGINATREPLLGLQRVNGSRRIRWPAAAAWRYLVS
jgi:hypothetical protein